MENKPVLKKATGLPWPENLLRAMEASAAKAAEKRARQEAEYAEVGLTSPTTVDRPLLTLPELLSSDQLEGLIHAITTLRDNEKKAIHLRFEEQRTLNDTAAEFGLTGSRIQQILAKALRKLQHPSRIKYIIEGFQGVLEAEERKKNEVREALESGDQQRIFNVITIYDLKLSVRAANCLIRSGLSALGDVVKEIFIIHLLLWHWIVMEKPVVA